jgi:hypothetical protein
MIEQEWDEENWQWESAILRLRSYIAKKPNNIFSNNQDEIFVDISKTVCVCKKL